MNETAKILINNNKTYCSHSWRIFGTPSTGRLQRDWRNRLWDVTLGLPFMFTGTALKGSCMGRHYTIVVVSSHTNYSMSGVQIFLLIIYMLHSVKLCYVN